jgi:hypothetical protein
VGASDLVSRTPVDVAQAQAAPEPSGSADLAALWDEIAAVTTVPASAGSGSAEGLAALRRELRSLDDSIRSTVESGSAESQRLASEAAALWAWVSARIPERAVDMERPAHLDELAGRLYDRIRGRIRQELLVDRERSGRLANLP